MKRVISQIVYHQWPACSTRSWWLTPARRTGRGRLPGSLGPECSISSGSMTLPRPGTRRSARATGDYAFWLDADDVIDPPEREKLQKLLASLRIVKAEAGNGPHSGPYGKAEQAAYVVKCSCDPGPNGDGGQTVVDHIRLFPLREDVRWTYRVHEQILPALAEGERAGDSGPISRSGTRDTPIESCASASSSATARSSKKNSPSGRTIRSCCSTWARSPSSGRTGERRSTFSGGASPARRRPVRPRRSSSP